MFLIFIIHCLACHALYQAHPKHSVFNVVISSLLLRISLRIIALLLFLLGLSILANNIGFERSVVVSIAMFCIAGLFNMLACGFFRRYLLALKYMFLSPLFALKIRSGADSPEAGI